MMNVVPSNPAGSSSSHDTSGTMNSKQEMAASSPSRGVNSRITERTRRRNQRNNNGPPSDEKARMRQVQEQERAANRDDNETGFRRLNRQTPDSGNPAVDPGLEYGRVRVSLP